MVKEDLGALGFNEPLTSVDGSKEVETTDVKKVVEREKEGEGFVAGKHMKNKRVWW